MKYPEFRERASKISAQGQDVFLAMTVIRLVALCAAGVLVPFETVGTAQAVVVAFVIAILADLFLFWAKPERWWYGGRAGAESVKTLAWRYAVRGNPFAEDAGAEEELRKRFIAIADDLQKAKLPVGPAGPELVTKEMQAARKSKLPDRIALYKKERLLDQEGWYGRNAKANSRWAVVWSVVLIALEGVALYYAFRRIANPRMFDWVGVAGAVGAAVAAWLQTKQHQNLASAYRVAARELEDIRDGLGSVQDEASWAQFVADAEEAMSREHTMWRARRS